MELYCSLTCILTNSKDEIVCVEVYVEINDFIDEKVPLWTKVSEVLFCLFFGESECLQVCFCDVKIL